MGRQEHERRHLDLERMVRQWAWWVYDKTATRAQRRLRERERRHPDQHVHVKVDWSRVKVKHATTWTDCTDVVTPASPAALPAWQTASQPGHPVPDSPVSTTPGRTCVFSTTYANNTSRPGTYRLRTSRVTRAYCMVEVRSGGLTRCPHGTPLPTLAPPKPARTGDAHTDALPLPALDGGVMQYEQHWDVDKTVQVPAYTAADLQVLTNERTLYGDFVIVSRLSGEVNVVFTDVHDNNSFVKTVSGDIVAITEYFLNLEKTRGNSWDFVHVERHDAPALISTRGTCSFRYNTNPHVTVQHASLPGI